VQSIRPGNTDPIPVRTASPKMGTIMMRCAGLLVVALILLVWAWHR
jgi:hypothetical protein